MASTELFHRTALAASLANQLLRPTALQMNIRSGVFLSGPRRVGKSTFLRQDVVPALETLGALVIYVDLWSDRSKNPSVLVIDAVRVALNELQTPGAGLLSRFKALNLGAAGFSFGFQIDRVGAAGGATLAQAFAALVSRAKTDVVLIVDEVQHALVNEDGSSLLHALKAARDAVNASPDVPGKFIFLGTGSHKALVKDMAIRRNQAFSGAVSAEFEVLGKDFVAWQIERIERSQPNAVLPSIDSAWDGFRTLGHCPEELLKALVQLQGHAGLGVAADTAFSIISSTLASAAADVDLYALRELGPLAQAIFQRVARGGAAGATGLFGEDAIADYAQATNDTVQPSQVQNLCDKLIAANLIARHRHGVYSVTDPNLLKATQLSPLQQLLEV